jgi:hypothetical protein
MPATAHWSAPDPAAHMATPHEAKRVIRAVTQLMQRRISLLVSLPSDKLDRMSLQSEVRALAANETVDLNLDVNCAIPGEYSGPASRAYLYYTNEHKQWTDGLRVEIEPIAG